MRLKGFGDGWFGGKGRCICWAAVFVAFSAGYCTAAQPQAPARRFLIVSDLHFNPMADARLVTELAAADPRNWEAILDRSQPAAFSQYGEDTNWWLLRSAYNAMRSTLPHPAFILLTGDLLAHRFPSTYQRVVKDSDGEAYASFVLKTVQFEALELQKRFPHIRILLTPGNNDEECGGYSIEAGGRFLHDTADLARKLAQSGEDSRSSWEELGSFDVPHPTLAGVRIISFNSVFFSDRYHAANFGEGCAQIPSTAPADLFAWMESRLGHAQQAHEKVWLMFHIPPGMDGYWSVAQYESRLKGKGQEPPAQVCASALVPMWAPQWTAKFNELLAKYQDTVIASFAAHIHSDDFRLINASSEHPSFVLLSPAISPIYNQNPGFRVATFGKDGSIADQSVYYLTNLLFASSTTPGEWNREYTFSQQWKLRGVNAASLSAIYRRVAHDPTAQAEWLKLFNVSSSAAYLPAGSTPGLYCADEALDPEAYGKCFCSTVSGPP